MIGTVLAAALLVLGGPESGLVDGAQAAYFGGRFDEALAALDEAEAEAPEFSGERPRIFLLRAAVRLKKGEPALAEEMAHAALLANPDLSVDDYPGDVRRLFDTARAKLPARVLLQITGVPGGADTRLDGRAVAGGLISAVPGAHELVVIAPGFERFERRLDLTKDESITVILTPLAVVSTPPASGGRSRRSHVATGVAFGVAALSAAEAGFSLYGLSVTRDNRAAAGPGQKSSYDSHVRRFTVGAGTGIVVAAVAGAYGTWRLARSPSTEIGFAPAPRGGTVSFTVRFGGPRASLRPRDAHRAVGRDGGAEFVGRSGGGFEVHVATRPTSPE